MDDLKLTPLSVSTGHAEKILDVGHTKLKDLIRDGQLKAVVAGRRILVDSIAAYHASLPKYVPGSTLDLAPLNPVKRKTRRARRTRKLPGQRAGGNRSNLKDAQK